MHPGTFLHRRRALLAAAQLTYHKPHTLGHTYASLLIQNGESLAYVRDQLGHSSIKTTVDSYGHLLPSGNKAAVDRLDDSPTTRRNLYASNAGMTIENNREEGSSMTDETIKIYTANG